MVSNNNHHLGFNIWRTSRNSVGVSCVISSLLLYAQVTEYVRSVGRALNGGRIRIYLPSMIPTY